MLGLVWIHVVLIIIAGLTLLYSLQMAKNTPKRWVRPTEAFMDYITAVEGDPSFLTESAAFPEGQQVLLKDFMTVKPALTPVTAASCASSDQSRQGELDGQYVQRTNNYRRDYPDNCSAPRSEFVGAIYVPKNKVGMVVPCDGDC